MLIGPSDLEALASVKTSTDALRQAVSGQLSCLQATSQLILPCKLLHKPHQETLTIALHHIAKHKHTSSRKLLLLPYKSSTGHMNHFVQ